MNGCFEVILVSAFEYDPNKLRKNCKILHKNIMQNCHRKLMTFWVGTLVRKRTVFVLQVQVQIMRLLLLGFTTLLNILGHQRRFRHRAWKVRQILLRGSNSAWGYFTCRKSTTRDPRLYFPSEGSHTQDFYALKKIHRTRDSRIQRRVW